MTLRQGAMELLNYLETHFYTGSQLTELTLISESDIADYQAQNMMPLPSYSLDLSVSSHSFTGQHQERQNVDFYAKGYVSWLSIVHVLQDADRIYNEFVRRYQNRLEQLRNDGWPSLNPNVNERLIDHMKEEWSHFLKGTYGLCTQTGLPEDIAAKEFAIYEIKALLSNAQQDDTQRLEYMVHLLDNVSAPFAPHERSNSSRQRLVTNVKREFKFE
ncbi:conserved hypothetical protein [Vibrio nigripulchritudo SFn27]|nr:conserved hypothetical protein [Vibrio nigripulchritudo BLFn1]CCN91887.1 conserved hypothetical protein [Vibrio nigripulchritudo SFn27]